MNVLTYVVIFAENIYAIKVLNSFFSNSKQLQVRAL